MTVKRGRRWAYLVLVALVPVSGVAQAPVTEAPADRRYGDAVASAREVINNFMNEHLGFGYGDATGYGVGESAGSSMAEWLGAEEGGGLSDAAGVVGGSMASIGTTVGLTLATGGLMSPLAMLGIGAGLGIAEDVASLAFGDEAVDGAIDSMIGDGSMVGGAIDAVAGVGSWAADGITSLWGD